MDDETQIRYRLLQLGPPDSQGLQRNIPFDDLAGLVTHHPNANRRAHLVDGMPRGVENGARRSYGVVGGEIQEIETARTDEYRALRADQVLLVKDFILEDSRVPSGGAGVREVDVPSPVAGYVGRIDVTNGLVDLLDRKGGDVILRARHLEPIAVQVGDDVAYGQSLGTQDRVGLPRTAGKHVHFEVDTRYYNLYERYVQDLSDGALSIDPSRRGQGLSTPVVGDDGTIRIGESAATVRVVQQELNARGVRDGHGRPFVEDGVYRLAMQPAIIRYQQDNGLQVSGDLDGQTMRALVPVLLPPHVNPEDPTRPRLPFEPRAGLGMNAGNVHPMLEHARRCVGQLDESMGRSYDAASERMAGSLACLAKQNGFDRIDHAMLSLQTGDTRAGERVFIVQGDPSDPAKRRAQMSTQEAVSIPVETSLGRLAVLEQASPQPAQTPQTDQLQEQVPQHRLV